MRQKALAAAIVSIMLAACGGGGGGASTSAQVVVSTPAPSTAIPDGLYTGTTSTGRTINGLVLDNGSYYFVYSVSNNPSVLAGVVQGSGAALGGNFTSTNAVDVNLEGNGVLPASLSAAYVPLTSFNGSANYPTQNFTTTFSSTYNKSYESAPSFAAISGRYAGVTGSPGAAEQTTIIVGSSGTLVGSGNSGCMFSGLVTPRTKGNVYDMSITFGAAPCLMPGGAFTGVAYLDSATNRLVAVEMNAARTTGVIFTGTKP